MTDKEIIALFDYTLLKADTSGKDIERICAEAMQYGFAAVAVNPYYVALAAKCLKGSPVAVCSAVGFPTGAHITEVKLLEAERAIEHGATEVDMIINIGALKTGDYDYVKKEIFEFCSLAKGRAISKLVLEACLLTDDEKRAVCEMAVECGADFVKTSTGFQPGGATVSDIRLMKEVVGDFCLVKASGGIKDLAAVKALVDAGARRIGLSVAVPIAKSILENYGE